MVLLEFSIPSGRSMAPGVDSASNRNEYQEYSGESYRLCVCVCVCVCDLETSKRGGLGPLWAIVPQKWKVLVHIK